MQLVKSTRGTRAPCAVTKPPVMKPVTWVTWSVVQSNPIRVREVMKSLSKSRKPLDHRPCLLCGTSMFMTSAGEAAQQVQAVNKNPGGCQGERSDTNIE